jgi:hypothetical protein
MQLLHNFWSHPDQGKNKTNELSVFLEKFNRLDESKTLVPQEVANMEGQIKK